MTPEITLILRATVLLGAGLFAARMLRRASASARHLVLAYAFAAVVALPIASVITPRLLVALPVDGHAAAAGGRFNAPFMTATNAAIAASPARAVAIDRALSPSLATVLRLVWLAGAFALLVSFGLAMWSLRGLRREAVPARRLQPQVEAIARELGVRRSVTLLTHEEVPAPLTCGIRHATVILPGDIHDWTGSEIRQALVHELEHVRRFDWGVQLMARLVCAAFWFIPLAWIAERRLRLDAERACDDAVVDGADTADYAEQLVSLARRMGTGQTMMTLGMANRSDLSLRVAALLDGRQRRGRIGRTVSLLTAGAVAVVLGTVAAIQVVEASNDDDTPIVEIAAAAEQSRRGDRSLYRAAARGDVQRMTALIDDGANVNRAFDGDGSPLIGAARAGHLDAVKLLLDRGADPNLAVGGDGNPLIMAAREGHRGVVALLLERGARVNELVPEDETALIQASGSGHADVVKLLLSRGADVNIRAWTNSSFDPPDGEWRTALSMAKRGRHDDMVKLLLAAGARE